MSKQAKSVIWFLALAVLPILAGVFAIHGAPLPKAPAIGQSNAGIRAELPSPTGPLAVGRIACHWTDATRAEPFSTANEAKREVMVYVWYPAIAQPNASTLPYLQDFTPLEKCATEAKMKGLLGTAYESAK